MTKPVKSKHPSAAEARQPPAQHLNAGEAVEWSTSQGLTHGTVKRMVTKTTEVGGHVAKATPERPQYEVQSAKSGKSAVHKPSSLRKLAKQPKTSAPGKAG